MLDLPDDCLLYLFNLNYPSFENTRALFLTCTKLNLLSDVYINNIIKKDFKLIIRDNNLKTPKQNYMLISKIYGSKFVLDKSKLQDLAIQSILTNNIELLELLHKTAAHSMKSKDTALILFRSALYVKSLDIVNYLLEQHQVIDEDLIIKIVNDYYSNKIDSVLIIKSIIDKNNEYKEDIMICSLQNNDLDIFKLFIGQNDLTDILNYVLNDTKTFSHNIINSIIRYYYSKNINQPMILETIVNLGNKENNDFIICSSLVNNDFNTLKPLINDKNVNDLLKRAIRISNIEITIYIVHNFEYDENIIISELNCKGCKGCSMCLTKEMIKVLESIMINKNKKYL